MKAEVRKSNRVVGRTARDWIRAKARAGSKLERKAAVAIGDGSSATAARVVVRPTKRSPMANAVFWGAKKRTGWYARYRFKDASGRQFPGWVGASWTPATPGEGPYVVNETLAARWDDIQDLYLDGQWAAIARAFPRGIT